MNLAATLLTISVNIGIALTVFAYALRAGSDELRLVLVRERRLLARSLLAIFVITPAIALAVVESIEMPNTAKVVIVALSLSILPPALPRKEHAAGGDRHFANALTLTVAIVTIPVVPLRAGGSDHRPTLRRPAQGDRPLRPAHPRRPARRRCPGPAILARRC